MSTLKKSHKSKNGNGYAMRPQPPEADYSDEVSLAQLAEIQKLALGKEPFDAWDVVDGPTW